MQKVVILLSVLGVSLALAMPVLARDFVLSDQQIEDIRTSCMKSQAALKRVHTSDALLRVNIGQRYENISLRLMAPLNSRIALNGLDVVDLATTTTSYNQELKDFVKNYREYETTVANALKLKCSEQPVEYHSLVDASREGRAFVRANMVRLDQLIKQYRSQVSDFSQKRDLK